MSENGEFAEVSDNPIAESASEVLETGAEAPDTENTQETQEPVEEPRFAIMIDGKEVQATAKEIAEWRKGNLREADYTRKTMALAEQRKAIQAEYQQAEALKRQYAEQLQQSLPYQAAKLQEMQAELDRLAQDDPAAWVAKRQQFDAEVSKFQRTQSDYQRIQAEQQQQYQAGYQQHLAAEAARLTEKIPEWTDSKRAAAEKAKLAEYLKTVGYDDQAIAQASDHKAIVMARKAMLYDDLMAKQKLAEKSNAPVPPSPVSGRGSGPKSLADADFDEFTRLRQKQIASRR